MNTYKLSKIIVFIISIIAAIFFITTLAVEITQEKNADIVTYYIIIAYIAFFIAILSVLYFLFKNLINHKDQLRSALISLGLMGGIILIAFIFADSTEVVLKDGVVISSMYSKIISTGLNTFYILAAISVAVLGWTNYSKLKK